MDDLLKDVCEEEKLGRLGSMSYLGGNCPIQGEGHTVDGYPWYFRARGNRWTFEVGGNKDGNGIGGRRLFVSCPYENEPYEAGWMPNDDAERFLRRCLRRYKYTRFFRSRFFVWLKDEEC